jgi:hypothetical protein
LRQLTERELAQSKHRSEQLSKEYNLLQVVSSDKELEFNSKLETLQNSFATERHTFEQAIEQLRDTLTKERLASGVASKDMLERIEQETESKYAMLLQDRERILVSQLEDKHQLESKHKEEEYQKELSNLRVQLDDLQSIPPQE